jgi:hypothetical protein
VGIRTIDVDKPVGTRFQLWMCPLLAGARSAVKINGSIFYSPAMAWLLMASDTREEWDEMFRSIPIVLEGSQGTRALDISTHPGNVNIPPGPLDKGPAMPYL